MIVLTLHDGSAIKAWLVGETAVSAESHIRNGYPHLLADWQAGNVKASVVNTEKSERFESEFFEVREQAVARKAAADIEAIKTARAEVVRLNQ